MSSKLLQGFLLGPWKVEPMRGVVSGANDETHHLEPKAMDVFVCLAEHANEVVTRDQLLDVAWGGNTAFDEQLTRVVGDLRRALHDHPGDSTYIETIPKRGYRLIGQIRLPESPGRSVSITQFNKHKLSFGIFAVLVLAIVYLVYDAFVIGPGQEEAPATTSAQVEDISGTNRWEMSIAVLPFVRQIPRVAASAATLREDNVVQAVTRFPARSLES